MGSVFILFCDNLEKIITVNHLYIISEGTEKTWNSSKRVENMRQNENYPFSLRHAKVTWK
jgi:hypothetical protein